MEQSKECSKCHNIKTIDKFHNLSTGKYGKHSICKECRSCYNKTIVYKRPIKGKLKCVKCNEIKDVSEYYSDKKISTGLQSYCKHCQKEKIYESQSKLNFFIKKQLTELKSKCEKNKVDLELNVDDIISIYNVQEGLCSMSKEMLTYYSGIKLTDNQYESKFNIKIDLIDKTKPYIPNNIQLLGNIVYRMKQNMSNQELLHLCDIIVSKNKKII